MLLCDQIIQRDAPLFHTSAMIPSAKEPLDMLQRDINSAHKFVLDRSLAATADAIDLKEIERVIGQCRLPFAKIWIECLQVDRIKFFAAPLDDAGRGYVYRPQRVGLLAQTREDNRLRFLATLIWSFAGPPCDVSSSMVSMLIDLSDDLSETIRMRKAFHLPIHEKKYELENRCAPIPSPYFSWMIEGLKYASDPIDLFKAQLDDWNHEPAFWWAVLALLNCRNVVETKTVSLDKLNRARGKRGVLPLAEHKLLRLRLPGAQYSLRRGESIETKMRGHFVRGHFKQRATGLYWWSDFFRGDPTRVVSKSYQVGLRKDHELT